MIFPQWDNDIKWQVYLTTGELIKAVLFLLLLTHVPERLTPLMMCGAVWYTTQAHQEWVGANDGSTETWEYWLVAAMALAVLLHLTKKQR